jgi:predicted RNase H-like nuclease (RuvC/YqgF family)
MNLLPAMYTDNNELINRLLVSINKLKELYEKEKETREQLQIENSELLEKLSQKDKELETLEVKIDTLKLAKSISNTGDTHDAKVKVLNLVREIDKCIALLNK